MSARGVFARDQPLALFVDVDGTLLEIAATPDRVRVPASLRNTLQLAHQREQGAFVLMSGRSLEEIDRLFAPCQFPAAAKHGLEVRLPSGEVLTADVDPKLLDPARHWLQMMAAENRGLLLEDKGVALAMHYRLAPGLENEVATAMNELAAELGDAFTVRSGKCFYEIMPSHCSEGSAIQRFMREREFVGRKPVFVADDPTDEPGFEAVNDLGGHSIRVGRPERTAARYHFSSVSTVVAWLRDRNLNR
jgi:trehalose 6-phosphate phosphatase